VDEVIKGKCQSLIALLRLYFSRDFGLVNAETNNF